MSISGPPSSALPIAHALLRILVVANWLAGCGIAVLLVGMPASRWIRTAIGIPEASGALLLGMCAIAALGLIAIPLNYLVLRRLLAIVETVRAGDPFVTANAERLQAIAWALLGLQILSLFIGAIGKVISTSGHRIHIDGGVSITGWLAVLLTFLLARVFAQGALMRDDLEGTV